MDVCTRRIVPRWGDGRNGSGTTNAARSRGMGRRCRTLVRAPSGMVADRAGRNAVSRPAGGRRARRCRAHGRPVLLFRDRADARAGRGRGARCRAENKVCRVVLIEGWCADARPLHCARPSRRVSVSARAADRAVGVSRALRAAERAGGVLPGGLNGPATERQRMFLAKLHGQLGLAAPTFGSAGDASRRIAAAKVAWTRLKRQTACPVCDARPGEPCRRRNGSARKYLHDARRPASSSGSEARSSMS